MLNVLQRAKEAKLLDGAEDVDVLVVSCAVLALHL